ncbi:MULTISPECIES: MazG-like protein [unclassified Streptococcus]|uniref:MazG-like protein n=1 Tax=unclassified Streptococcus TaxID=2608887 RepID=UPI0018AC3931|nr:MULTISPECIES: MazG-like protein [unclassified Streptococcus]MBF8970023.1 MazG-like protein [Streptococcus sp. NLN76]MBG9367940.1 MazG-like protein [Streptococcus sp. NLN64]
MKRSIAVREAYHKLEEANHGSRWSIEEDFLALSNDVGNLQRLVMTKQGRYYDETPYRLESKLAENMWWLLEFANRLDIDVEAEMEEFLSEKEVLLGLK